MADLQKELLKNISKDDLERMLVALMDAIDPLVTYEQACKITGKSLNALYCKISRSNITPVHNRKMLRYSDVIKIRDKII